MESHDILLLCDEKLFFSTPSPPPAPRDARTCGCVKLNSAIIYDDASKEENDHVLQNYLNREQNYKPTDGYMDHLQFSSELCAARLRAVRWIVMARSRLSLQYGTIFAAVNYLDRFISLKCHIKKWEVWMIELLSIACLSIASKVDEVFIHSLDDYQTEELEHTYQSSTIERMELAVLKALDWRLVCITPYSYVDLLNYRLASPHPSLASHTVELLLRALLEVKFVDCSASSIVVSALRCSIEELIPLDSDAYLSILEHLMPVERKVEMCKCHRLMEEQISDPHCCPMSPVTVIPTQRTKVLDRYVDIDTCFLCKKDSGQGFNQKKRKLEA